MTPNGVHWSGMAKFKRDQLPEKDRRQLEKAVARLEGVPPDRWPSKKLIPLDWEEPAYLLLVPNGWRAVVSPTANNGVQVHNVLHEKAIQYLQESDADEGEPG
jgi:hypothetical protein